MKINTILNTLRINLSFPGKGPQPGRNIYHCCIQKTASQWIKSILADWLVFKAGRMKVHIPHKNFLGTDPIQGIIDNPLPVNRIITPLYIRYDDFLQIPKPGDYKAFFVMRDPRDLVISWYFSTKYSHRKNPSVKKRRKTLETMADEEAITYLCKNLFGRNNGLYKTMRSWYLNSAGDENIMIVRYEDLIGEEQLDAFRRLMAFAGIDIGEEVMEYLLEKYSFKNLSGGREAGRENRKSHYRKGISGDWQNHFTEGHKRIYKEENGQLLIDLGYEQDMEW